MRRMLYKSPEEAMEFYMGALDEIGKFCAKEVKPSAAEIDREGCRFENGEVILPEKLVEHMRRCTELGVFSAPSAANTAV